MEDLLFVMYMRTELLGFLSLCIFIGFVVFIMVLIFNHDQIFDILELLFFFLGGQLRLEVTFFHEDKEVFEERL